MLVRRWRDSHSRKRLLRVYLASSHTDAVSRNVIRPTYKFQRLYTLQEGQHLIVKPSP